jgi:hypothetical protein
MVPGRLRAALASEAALLLVAVPAAAQARDLGIVVADVSSSGQAVAPLSLDEVYRLAWERNPMPRCEADRIGTIRAEFVRHGRSRCRPTAPEQIHPTPRRTM